MIRESRHVWRPSVASSGARGAGAVAVLVALIVGLLSFGLAGSASAAQGYPPSRSTTISFSVVQQGNCYHVVGSVSSDSGKPAGRVDTYLDARLVKSTALPASGKFDVPIGCDPKTRASHGCGASTRVGGLAPGPHNITAKFVPSSDQWSSATSSRNFLVKASACHGGGLPTGVDAGLGGAGAGADHTLRILLDVLALLALAGLCYGYRRSGEESTTQC